MTVERSYIKLMVFALLVGMAICVSPTPAGASEKNSGAQDASDSANMLDGKRFKGQTGEKGKDIHHDDVLIFKDGQFTSTECFQYGFQSGAYTATVESDAIHFKAETLSPTHGKMEWRGTLKGDTLDVTYVWTKERWIWSIYREYWFKGTLVK